jgi:hypothetical protein
LSVQFFGTYRERQTENQCKVAASELKLDSKLFKVEAEKKNENIIKNSVSASALFFWEHSCHKCDITKSDHRHDMCTGVRSLLEK